MPSGTATGRMRDLSARGSPEVALPLVVAILLGVFWLGVLVTVAFTAWRLLANLKALLRSLNELSERLQRRQAARQGTGRRKATR